MPRKHNAKLQTYSIKWNLVNLFIKLFSTTVYIVIMWGHNMTCRPIYLPQWYVILPLLLRIRGRTGGGHCVYLYRGQWAPLWLIATNEAALKRGCSRSIERPGSWSTNDGLQFSILWPGAGGHGSLLHGLTRRGQILSDTSILQVCPILV